MERLTIQVKSLIFSLIGKSNTCVMAHEATSVYSEKFWNILALQLIEPDTLSKRPQVIKADTMQGCSKLRSFFEVL